MFVECLLFQFLEVLVAVAFLAILLEIEKVVKHFLLIKIGIIRVENGNPPWKLVIPATHKSWQARKSSPVNKPVFIFMFVNQLGLIPLSRDIVLQMRVTAEDGLARDSVLTTYGPSVAAAGSNELLDLVVKVCDSIGLRNKLSWKGGVGGEVLVQREEQPEMDQFILGNSGVIGKELVVLSNRTQHISILLPVDLFDFGTD